MYAFAIQLALLLTVVDCGTDILYHSVRESPNFINGINRCLNETDMQEYTDKIEGMLHYEYPPSNDDDFDRFIHCLWKSLGLINKDEEINYVALRALLIRSLNMQFDVARPTDVAQRAIEKCNGFDGRNVGQKVVRTENCIKLFLSEESLG